MSTAVAYAQGALVKLAEHGVLPVDFMRAAMRSQDSLVRKVAYALVEYEKIAGKGKVVGEALEGAAEGAADVAKRYGGEVLKGGKDLAEGAAGAVADVAGAARGAAGDVAKGGKDLARGVSDAAEDALIAAGGAASQGYEGLHGAADSIAGGVAASPLVPQVMGDAAQASPLLTAGLLGAAMPAAGALGAGGMYAAGPADTGGNEAAALANRYFGTDFDIQSRLGAGIEGGRDLAGQGLGGLQGLIEPG